MNQITVTRILPFLIFVLNVSKMKMPCLHLPAINYKIHEYLKVYLISDKFHHDAMQKIADRRTWPSGRLRSTIGRWERIENYYFHNYWIKYRWSEPRYLLPPYTV